MQESDIRDMVFSGFKRDMEYMAKHNIEENKWCYELELFLITLKSLVSNQALGGNTLDYGRFNRELKLWESYRHGGDKIVMDVLRGDRCDYWHGFDESLLTRITPIILANEDSDIVKDQILRHIFYFTARPSRVLDGLVYGSLLSAIIRGLEGEDLLESLKRDVIELSIMEDIVKRKYLVVDLDDYDGDYVVDFERERVGLIMSLGSVESNLDSLTQLLNSKKSNASSKHLEFLAPLIMREGSQYKNDFLEGISNYIYRLRKGRVTPKSVDLGEDIDIFKLRLGQVVTHPLLNRIELLSVTKRDGFEVRLVKSRSGIYRFFKK